VPQERLELRLRRLAAAGTARVLAGTALRLSGRARAAEALAKEFVGAEEELIRLARDLGPGALPPRVRPVEEVVSLDGVAWTVESPAAFLSKVVAFLDPARAGDAVEVGVRRGIATVVLRVALPDRGDLEVVAPRLAELREDLFPASLLPEVRSRWGALPPFAKARLEAPARARLEALLVAERGTFDDAEFLRERVLRGACARHEEGVAARSARRAALEKELVKPGAAALVFKDGRRLLVQLEHEDADGVRVRSTLGTARIPRSELARVEKGGDEFSGRYAAARSDRARLSELLRWTESKAPPEARELAALALLEADPQSDTAARALGLVAGGEDLSIPWERIRFKDGGVQEGLVVAESELEVVMDVRLRGSLGDTVGLARAVFPRARVDSVERRDEETRSRLRERLARFTGRHAVRAGSSSSWTVAKADFQGVSGLRITASAFELWSDAPEGLAREVGFWLEECFSACRKAVAPRRNLTALISVVLLKDEAGMLAFQQRAGGPTAPTPAAYDPAGNRLVVAASRAMEEDLRLRARLQELQASLVVLKRQVGDAENEFRKRSEAYRKELDGFVTGKAAEREEARRETANRFRLWERDEKERLEEFRGYTKDGIQIAERQLAEGKAAREILAKDVYEALFHEAFHAYAANHLPEGKGFPSWLHEGLACLFERSVRGLDGLGVGGPYPELSSLLKEARKKAPGRLAGLLAAEAFPAALYHRGVVPRHRLDLAESWGLVRFVLTRGGGGERLQAYLDALEEGKDGFRAFEALAGMPIPEAEPAWRAFEPALR
jgi:hypothetical protein